MYWNAEDEIDCVCTLGTFWRAKKFWGKNVNKTEKTFRPIAWAKNDIAEEVAQSFFYSKRIETLWLVLISFSG